jgi:hypothetical protein
MPPQDTRRPDVEHRSEAEIGADLRERAGQLAIVSELFDRLDPDAERQPGLREDFTYIEHVLKHQIDCLVQELAMCMGAVPRVERKR